jgi:hypothetical protein
MPSAIPAEPGDILELSPDDYKWYDAPLRLRVTRARDDLRHQHDDDWVWIEGDELDSTGTPIRWTQVLVRLAALTGLP